MHTIRSKSRGRPVLSNASKRAFVELGARVEAKADVIRAARFSTVTLELEWHRTGARQILELRIRWTAQPLGGRRGWFACPGCRRRCGVLLGLGPGEPFACRKCHRAVYMSDYPTRQLLARAFGVVPMPDADTHGDLQRRRRGVRRPRGVRRRAARLKIQRTLAGGPISCGGDVASSRESLTPDAVRAHKQRSGRETHR